jgi:outer membrane protein assembly factor BamA
MHRTLCPGLFAAKLAAIVLFLAFAISFPLAAQNADKPDSEGVIGNTAPLVSLTFNGLSHFSEAQALEVSALHVGQIVGKDDFKAAADRVAQSGGFDRVAYRFSSGPTGVTLQFDLVETSRLISCVFENFVWFSDDEIAQAVEPTVPLYTNRTIPANGPSLNQMTDALDALLQSESIPGAVQRISMGTGAGDVTRISFRVNGVTEPVTAVSFPGADGGHIGDLQGASFGLIGQDYSMVDTEQFVGFTLGAYYRHRGYFRIQFGEPRARLVDAAGGAPYKVAVTIPVSEGPVYLWGGQTWTGNQAIKSGDLDKMLAMAPKQVADGDALDAGIAAIRKAYAAHGYIDTAIQRQDHFDDDARVMNSDFSIVEGVQYHMGHVTFTGVADSQAKKLTSEWQLKPGDIYDGTYFETTFLKKASFPVSSGKRNANVNVVLKRNPQTATVDVTFIVR